MNRARTRRALARLLVCALPLAACTALPKASAPARFDVSVPDSSQIRLSAEGPVDGSDPQTLVTDFLLACAAGAADDFATARLFLTAESAQAWAPQKQVLVYDTATRPVVTVEGDASASGSLEASVSVSGIASVDSSGVLTRADSTPITKTLRLVKASGQWRIESPEDSFLVSRASFVASYARADLYFPATTGDALVPDPRWYPSRRLASHLLAGLVAGPSAAIGPAVRNAIPGGTTIPSGSVEAVGATAKVVLNAPVPEEGASRDLLVWQIRKTLAQVPSITEVSIDVPGVDLTKVASPTGPAYSLDTRIGLAEGAIGTISASRVVPLDLDVHPGPGASSPAMSPVARDLVAWREGADLVVERTGEGGARAVATVGGEDAPSIDRFGWTWSALSGGSAIALDVSGAQVPFDAKALDGRVRRIAVSPDGARALLIGDARDPGLRMAPILRDADGRPTGLGTVEPLAGVGADVVDASWSGSGSFVVVRDRPGEGPESSGVELAEVEVAGLVSSSTAPEGAVEVSAGSTAFNVCARTSDRSVHCRVGALWQDMPSSIVDIRFPG